MNTQSEASGRWLRLSRRGFLRAGGMSALGLAGAALVGCGEDTPETPSGAATTAPSGGTAKAAIGNVDVLGIWGEQELEAFNAMVDPWQERTGGTVQFTGTRDITAVLTTRVEGNNPPDIAIPAEIGLFRQFATEGKLASLADLGVESEVKSNYPQGFRDLATINGKSYGFFMKADSKATIWYNPKLFKERGWKPLTASSKWEDLIALSDEIKAAGMAPWSMGVESAGASGWPGTDWIQQIVLNVHGADTYDGIIDGTVPFTDAKMKDSWERFRQIALTSGYTVQGGASGINATNFQDSAYPPFEAQPRAAMVFLGSFAGSSIKTQFPNLKAGEDYDFFPFPGGRVTGGANIAYAFNANDGTKSLMDYLSKSDSQVVWVKEGGFTSVNKKTDLGGYPDLVARKQAEQLLDADVFRFDLDDAIGGSLQQAYFTGITQYLADPSKLDQILTSIEGARSKM